MTKGIPPLFNPSKLSYYAFMTILTIGIILLVSVSFMAWRRSRLEGFVGEELDKALEIGKEMQSAKSDSEIKTLMSRMVSELVSVGAFPDTSQFVRKSEMVDGRCVVAKADDRDQYIAKTSIPDQGPRIDMSQYIKKSAIPACPQQKCPEPVDLSGYVKKSSLFNQKQNACVCPQVKVSAGLCKECPPCPSMTCAPCPVPEKPKCPPPAPCPEPPTQPVRYEIKYIKQPVLITKTVVVDANNKVLSQQVKTDTNASVDDITKNPEVQKDSGFYEFIDSIRSNYGLKYNPEVASTRPQITMASAPFCGEAGCLENKNLNSAFQQQGVPQGMTTM